MEFPSSMNRLWSRIRFFNEKNKTRHWVMGMLWILALNMQNIFMHLDFLWRQFVQTFKKYRQCINYTYIPVQFITSKKSSEEQSTFLLDIFKSL